jgi:AcrR family transcriptional regulator
MKRDRATREERIQKASRHRREEEKEELRQTILKVAGELFLEQGYDRFSMRHIAEEIGYSPGTLYLYFRDKDALLFTIVDEGFSCFEQQLAQALASSNDPLVQLQALGRAYVTFGLHNPVYYQLMFQRRVDFLMQTRVGEQNPRLEAFHVLQKTVQAAMDMDMIQAGDAESISDALWAMVHGIVTLAISVPKFDTQRLPRLIDVALDLLFKALAQR